MHTSGAWIFICSLQIIVKYEGQITLYCKGAGMYFGKLVQWKLSIVVTPWDSCYREVAWLHSTVSMYNISFVAQLGCFIEVGLIIQVCWLDDCDCFSSTLKLAFLLKCLSSDSVVFARLDKESEGLKKTTLGHLGVRTAAVLLLCVRSLFNCDRIMPEKVCGLLCWPRRIWQKMSMLIGQKNGMQPSECIHVVDIIVDQ